MTTLTHEPRGLLSPGEAATMCHVSRATLRNWELAGRLSAIRTPGGHRRYYETEVLGLIAYQRTRCAAAPGSVLANSVRRVTDAAQHPSQDVVAAFQNYV